MSNCPNELSFLEHIQSRLELDSGQALETLGYWLVRYQPAQRYELRFLQRTSGARTASQDAA